MSILISLEWAHMTDDDRRAQHVLRKSLKAGHVGLLREQHAGAPYATQHLVPETFDDENQVHAEGSREEIGRFRYRAAVLRERLPQTMTVAQQRLRRVFHERNLDTEHCKAVLKSFEDFVVLAERVDAELGFVDVVNTRW
jgi:hypothetical protein